MDIVNITNDDLTSFALGQNPNYARDLKNQNVKLKKALDEALRIIELAKEHWETVEDEQEWLKEVEKLEKLINEKH